MHKAQEHIHRGIADPRLLAIPASCRRVAACNPNWGTLYAILLGAIWGDGKRMLGYNERNQRSKESLPEVARHANKHIRAALQYAADCGWTVNKSSARAHAWGTMNCQFGHRSCWMAVYSTPTNPENHAKDIRRKVNRCPGATEE